MTASSTRRQAWTSLLALAVTVVVSWQGLRLMSERGAAASLVEGAYRLVGASEAADAVATYGLTPVTSKIVVAVVGLVIGVGAVWALFVTVNRLVDLLGPTYERLVRPWVFVVPSLVLLGFFLVYPIVRTVWISLTAGATTPLGNYLSVFSDPAMLAALRINVLWLVLGTSGSVVMGLAFAALVDRVKREALAKTFVFLPLAISMVGAAVIWRFVYYWRPPGQPQIGLANAVLEGIGREPIAFFQSPPLNTLVLILIMIWLQTGFAMVILSAAIKGVPEELVEAARIDGASELQIFRRVVVPTIRGSIITVATTIFIVILKVFDIVFVTTGGRFDTDVVANRMFSELIRFRNPGRTSALAVILLVAVIPIMVVNVRNLRRQGISS